MNGLVVMAVGLVLCFLGVGSVHLAVPASGFAIGWLLADNLGATSGTALLIALGGAVVAWVVVTLIFRASLFFVGAIAGGVVGSKFYTLLQGDDSSVILAIVFVLAMAAIGGFLTNRFRQRFLVWMCALGGAGIVLSGLAEVAPSLDAWVHDPDTAVESVTAGGTWVALAVTGWLTQRRLFPRVAGHERGGAS